MRCHLYEFVRAFEQIPVEDRRVQGFFTVEGLWELQTTPKCHGASTVSDFAVEATRFGSKALETSWLMSLMLLGGINLLVAEFISTKKCTLSVL